MSADPVGPDLRAGLAPGWRRAGRPEVGPYRRGQGQDDGQQEGEWNMTTRWKMLGFALLAPLTCIATALADVIGPYQPAPSVIRLRILLVGISAGVILLFTACALFVFWKREDNPEWREKCAVVLAGLFVFATTPWLLYFFGNLLHIWGFSIAFFLLLFPMISFVLAGLKGKGRWLWLAFGLLLLATGFVGVYRCSEAAFKQAAGGRNRPWHCDNAPMVEETGEILNGPVNE